MQLPEELRSPRVLSIGLGVLGSLFAAASIKDATPTQRFLMFLAGSVGAAICTPPIVALVKAPDGWAYAIAFLIGFLTWALMGKTLSTIRDADVWGLASDIIRSWLTRR